MRNRGSLSRKAKNEKRQKPTQKAKWNRRVIAHDAHVFDAMREFVSLFKPREYMVPSAFVRMESFPLSPNGKVDRKALPRPDMSAMARRTSYVRVRCPISLSLPSWCGDEGGPIIPGDAALLLVLTWFSSFMSHAYGGSVVLMARLPVRDRPLPRRGGWRRGPSRPRCWSR